MSEWQPIETAMKGQAIVFDEKLGIIPHAFLFGNDGRATYGLYNNVAYNVTHWMPLPEPPK